MGSPSARLKTRESLRPWVESGLQFVYCPGGLSRDEIQPVPEPQAAPASPSRRAPQPQGATPVSASPQPDSAPVSNQPQAAASRGQDFPAPWAGFLKYTKPTAKVVLTYMELGLDLGGQSDPRRRNVLKNLQAHLNWPPGTINFWPVAALNAGALQPDRAMFWRGWELWRTPYIACFGEEALKVILPDADPGVTTHMLENVIVHVLPPLAKLVTLLPHEQQMAVDGLTTIRL